MVHQSSGRSRGALNPQLWFGQVDQEKTTIWAQFPGVNPNEQQVEINVRQTVFYPEKTGVNYITVRGFTMRARRHALGAADGRADRPDRHPLEQGLDHREQRRSATPYARASRWGSTATSGTTPPPTPPRATSRPSSGASRTAGTRRPSATTSSATTPSRTASRRASSAAWAPRSARSPATSSTTSTCGSSSPAPRWRASSSTAPSTSRSAATTSTGPAWGSGWTGWPRARASRATCSTTTTSEDLFVEVDHGPFLVDNNIFLSPTYAAERVAGRRLCPQPHRRGLVINPYDGRQTPFHKAHSTEVAGHARQSVRRRPLLQQPVRRQRRPEPVRRGASALCMDGNVFLNGARPAKQEKTPVTDSALDPRLKLSEKSGRVLALVPVRPSLDARPRCGKQSPPICSARRPLRAFPMSARWHANSHRHRLLWKAERPFKPDSRPIRASGKWRDHAEGLASARRSQMTARWR